MEYGNYYTEETLRSLNAAYDTLYGITSRETEKVNGIIRRMDVYGVYAFYSVCDDVYCDDRNKNNNVHANSCYDNESCHRTGYNMLNRV